MIAVAHVVMEGDGGAVFQIHGFECGADVRQHLALSRPGTHHLDRRPGDDTEIVERTGERSYRAVTRDPLRYFSAYAVIHKFLLPQVAS